LLCIQICFFSCSGVIFCRFFRSGRTCEIFFSAVRRNFFSVRPYSLALSAQRDRESPYSLALLTSGKRETSRCPFGQNARPLRSRVPFGKTANIRGLPSGKTRIGSFAGCLLLSRERSRVGPLQTANTLKIGFFGRTIRFFLFFPPSSVRICHFGSGTIFRSSS